MDPPAAAAAANNSEYAKLFQNACRSLTQLAQLIDEKLFDINGSLSNFYDLPPLVSAIQEGSLHIVSLLLEHGADPNVQNQRPLRLAIKRDDPKLVQLLLQKGANPNLCNLYISALGYQNLEIAQLLLECGVELSSNNYYVVQKAISQAANGSTKPLESILERASQILAADPDADDGRLVGVVKYCRLCQAIFKNDEAKVTQLLESADYKSDPRMMDDSWNRLAYIIQIFGNHNMLKVLVRANVDIQGCYFIAARTGDLEMLELCAANSSSGFDLHVRDEDNRNPLHEACINHQIGVVRVLVSKYGLDLNAMDKFERTPICYVKKSDMLRELLNSFSEIDLAVTVIDGRSTCYDHLPNSCQFRGILLEHGISHDIAYEFGNHPCCYDRNPNCAVFLYLEKLLLLDPNHASKIVAMILGIDVRKFCAVSTKYRRQVKEECKKELVQLHSLPISQSTSLSTRKSLFDYIFLGANEAARFSRNEVILEIYEEHGDDFNNFLPQYGFALNYQLRRGTARWERLEAAGNLLCFAFGVDVPEDFPELIFGHFSNRRLEGFSLPAKPSD